MLNISTFVDLSTNAQISNTAPFQPLFFFGDGKMTETKSKLEITERSLLYLMMLRDHPCSIAFLM